MGYLYDHSGKRLGIAHLTRSPLIPLCSSLLNMAQLTISSFSVPVCAPFFQLCVTIFGT